MFIRRRNGYRPGGAIGLSPPLRWPPEDGDRLPGDELGTMQQLLRDAWPSLTPTVRQRLRAILTGTQGDDLVWQSGGGDLAAVRARRVKQLGFGDEVRAFQLRDANGE